MSLVEVLFGASILSIFIVALVVVFQSFLVHSFSSMEKVQATLLAEEGLEAMKFVRDRGWEEHIGNLVSGDTYYVSFENNLWHATTVEQDMVDGRFYRTIVIEDVLRDSNDDISDSGTNDPNTKKVSSYVSWLSGEATSTVDISTYITNLHE